MKLSKYKNAKGSWIKATASKPKGGLDLRLEHDRFQSQFLHRLNLLEIVEPNEVGDTGNIEHRPKQGKCLQGASCLSSGCSP